MNATSVIAGLVLRGYLKASAIGANGFRRLAVSLGWQDDADEVPHVQEYGFATHPIPGAEPFAVRVGASADQAVAILVADRRYTLRGLAEGEVALYDDRGQTVRLGRDGIHVSATGVCNITSSGVTTVEGSSIKLGDNATDALVKNTPFAEWATSHTHTAGSTLTVTVGGTLYNVTGQTGGAIGGAPATATTVVKGE